jgi:hypothetical protein
MMTRPPPSLPTPGHGTAAMIVLTIGIGLQIDQHWQPWGQFAVSIWCWGFVFWLIRRAPPPWRWVMLACLVISTIGEVFASLVWGLYAYRLHNIPAFIPPGHLMMWLLGFYASAHLARLLIPAAVVAAIGWTGYGLASGLDQAALPMAAFLAAALIFGDDPRRYAATFLLAIALELYGTSIGNWRWVADAPWLHLSMTNPPLCAGGLYCVRDVLVAFFTMGMMRWRSRRRAAGDSARPISGAGTA